MLRARTSGCGPALECCTAAIAAHTSRGEAVEAAIEAHLDPAPVARQLTVHRSVGAPVALCTTLLFGILFVAVPIAFARDGLTHVTWLLGCTGFTLVSVVAASFRAHRKLMPEASSATQPTRGVP